MLSWNDLRFYNLQQLIQILYGNGRSYIVTFGALSPCHA